MKKPLGKVINLKQPRFKCPWGEKELYYGLVFNHPTKADGSEQPVTITKRDDKMFTEVHELLGMPLGEYEVVFI